MESKSLETETSKPVARKLFVDSGSSSTVMASTNTTPIAPLSMSNIKGVEIFDDEWGDDFVLESSIKAPAISKSTTHSEDMNISNLFGDVIENYFSSLLDPVVQSSLQSLLQDLPSVPAIDLAVASHNHFPVSTTENSYVNEIVIKIANCTLLRDKKLFSEAQVKLEEIWLQINSQASTNTAIAEYMPFLIIVCLLEIGRNSKDQKNYDRALASFQQALDISVSNSRSHQQVFSENEELDVVISSLHYEMGMTSEALNKGANSTSSYLVHLRLLSKMRPSKINWGEFGDSCYRLACTLKNGESNRLAEEYCSRATAAASKANDLLLSEKCATLLSEILLFNSSGNKMKKGHRRSLSNGNGKRSSGGSFLGISDMSGILADVKKSEKKPSISDSEDDDWGKEFEELEQNLPGGGIDQTKLTSLRQALTLGETVAVETSEEENVHTEQSLIDFISQKNETEDDETTVKPSVLLPGHTLPLNITIPRNGAEMRSWLESIMDIVAPRNIYNRITFTESQEVANFRIETQSVEYLSYQWAYLYYVWCKRFYKLNFLNPCRNLIFTFFTCIRSIVPSLIESNNEERIKFLQLCKQFLFIASKIRRNKEDQDHIDLARYVAITKLLTVDEWEEKEIILLELELKSHLLLPVGGLVPAFTLCRFYLDYKEMEIVEEEEDAPQSLPTPAFNSRKSGSHIPEIAGKGLLESEPRSRGVSYSDGSTINVSTNLSSMSSLRAEEIKKAAVSRAGKSLALVNMHLFLSGISPLTCAKLPPVAQTNIDRLQCEVADSKYRKARNTNEFGIVYGDFVYRRSTNRTITGSYKWKRRFLIIKGTVLKYCTVENNRGDEENKSFSFYDSMNPRGSIELTNCRVVEREMNSAEPEYPYSFDVIFKTKVNPNREETWYFATKNSDLMKLWIQAITFGQQSPTILTMKSSLISSIDPTSPRNNIAFPSTPGDGKGDAGSSTDSTILMRDINYRIETLLVELQRLPKLTYIRAKSAYALGMSFNESGDVEMAEKLLFECLLILSHLTPTVIGDHSSHPLVSEFGVSALLTYAEVLLENGKYSISMLAYESAALCLRTRGKLTQVNALYRKVAVIASDHNDSERSLALYTIILSLVRESRKIEEVLYISETISRTHCDRGEFSAAKSILRETLNYINEISNLSDISDTFSTRSTSMHSSVKSNSSSTMKKKIHSVTATTLDAKAFATPFYVERLMLRLIYTCIDTGSPLEGLQVINSLFEHIKSYSGGIAHDFKLVALLRTRIYALYKARKHELCSCAIADYRVCNNKLWDQINDTKKGNNIPSTVRILYDKETIASSKIWKISILNYSKFGFHWEAIKLAKTFVSALESIESQISANTLGSVCFLAGKVLQAAAKSSNLLRFPVKIENDISEMNSIIRDMTGHDESYIPPPELPLGSPNSSTFSRGRLYTCCGQLTIDAVRTYRRAYEFFKKVNDDIGIAKAASRIAETYLDKVFPSTAILKIPLEVSCIIFNNNSINYKTTSTFDKRSSNSPLEFKSDGNRVTSEENRISKRLSGTAIAAVLAEATKSKMFSPTGGAKPTTPNFKEEGSDGMGERGPSALLTDQLGLGAGNKNQVFDLSDVDSPASVALEVFVNTCNVIELLRSYINMAELRHLQGRVTLAFAYWSEARDLLLKLFVDGTSLPIARSAPISTLEDVETLIMRIVRFLFVCETSKINSNLLLLDIYLMFEIDMKRARSQQMPATMHTSAITQDALFGFPLMNITKKRKSAGNNTNEIGENEADKEIDTFHSAFTSLFGDGLESEDSLGSSIKSLDSKNSYESPATFPKSRNSVNSGRKSVSKIFDDINEGGEAETLTDMPLSLSMPQSPSIPRSTSTSPPKHGRSVTAFIASAPEVFDSSSKGGPHKPSISSGALSNRVKSGGSFSGWDTLNIPQPLNITVGTSNVPSSPQNKRMSTKQREHDAATISWYTLYHIKKNSKKYSTGRLSEESIRKMNRNSLVNLARRIELTRKSSLQPTLSDMTYENMLKLSMSSAPVRAPSSDSDCGGLASLSSGVTLCERLKRLAYILHVGDIAMFYTPFNGNLQHTRIGLLHSHEDRTVKLDKFSSGFDSESDLIDLEISTGESVFTHLSFKNNLSEIKPLKARDFPFQPPPSCPPACNGCFPSAGTTIGNETNCHLMLMNQRPQSTPDSMVMYILGEPAPFSGVLTQIKLHLSSSPTGDERDWEVHIYSLDDKGLSILINRRSIRVQRIVRRLQTVLIDPPMKIQPGQYVGIANCGGALCLSFDSSSSEKGWCLSERALFKIGMSLPLTKLSGTVGCFATLQENWYSCHWGALEFKMIKHLEALLDAEADSDWGGGEVLRRAATKEIAQSLFGNYQSGIEALLIAANSDPQSASFSSFGSKKDQSSDIKRYQAPEKQTFSFFSNLFRTAKESPLLQAKEVRELVHPVVLITNRHLQWFPWEQMLDTSHVVPVDVIRNLSIVSLLNVHSSTGRSKPKNLSSNMKLPMYLTCFHGCTNANSSLIHDSEDMRRKFLIKDFLASILHLPDAPSNFPIEYPKGLRGELNMGSPGKSIPTVDDINWKVPFQTPLLSLDDIKQLSTRKSTTLKQKNWKYVSFLDVSDINNSPSSILSLIGNHTPSSKQFIVFLATYGDLVEMNESILWVLSYRHDCPILFIPNGSTEIVVSHLHRLQEDIEKCLLTQNDTAKWKKTFKSTRNLLEIPDSCRSPYTYLMNAILVLKNQHSIPLVLFNAPSN